MTYHKSGYDRAPDKHKVISMAVLRLMSVQTHTPKRSFLNVALIKKTARNEVK